MVAAAAAALALSNGSNKGPMENIELMMSMCGVWLQLKILVPKNADLAKKYP